MGSSGLPGKLMRSGPLEQSKIPADEAKGRTRDEQKNLYPERLIAFASGNYIHAEGSAKAGREGAIQQFVVLSDFC